MAGPWEKYGATQVTPNRPGSEYQVPKAGADLDNTRASTGRTVVQTQGDLTDNAIKRATQAAAIAKANAEAVSAQHNAQGLTPEIIQQQKQRAKDMESLGAIINSLTDQYNRSFKGAGGSSGRGIIAEVLPGTLPFGLPGNKTNNLFDSTAMRAAPFVKSMLFPGSKDTDAAAEYQQKIMPFIPQHNDPDETIADKIKQLRGLYARQMGHPIPAPPAPQRTGNRSISFNDLP